MAMKKTHDIVNVEKYTDRSGEEKKRYTNVGSLLQRDDGSMAIKLESIPVMFSGWLACYEPKPRDQDRPAQSAPKPADRPAAGGGIEDDIPFAPLSKRTHW